MGFNRTLLINIFFILFVLFVSVSGQVEQRNRGNVQRNTLEVLTKDDVEASIMATRGEGPGEGRRIKSTFSARGFPNFRVSRWSSVGEPDEQAGVSVRLSLLSIVEYLESPSGQWGIDTTDTIISTLPLVNMSFDPLVIFEDAQDDISYKYFILDSTEKSSVNLPNIFDNFASMDPELTSLPLVRIGAGISDLRGFVGRLNRTLSPSTWQFGIEVFGFPYKRNDTFLAVKFAIETQDEPYLRYDLSYTERDDPFITMNDIQSNSPNSASGIAKDDIAYFSWEVTAVSTGGVTFNRTRNWVQDGVLVSEVVLSNSALLDFDQDTITSRETILDSVDYGRNMNETSRAFMYFSLPVRNATSVNWDPYVGIDEKDDPYVPSNSFVVTASFVLSVLCIVAIIV